MLRAGGKADGWGVRACAVALTVGKDLLVPFPSLEKERKKVGLIFWLLFHLWKSNGKGILYLDYLAVPQPHEATAEGEEDEEGYP